MAAMLQPFPVAVTLQCLAYHTGIARGYDVDRPRSLAKSVTAVIPPVDVTEKVYS